MMDSRSRYLSPPYLLGLVEDERAGSTVLQLKPLPAGVALQLGAQFAAMTPWAEYGFPAERLAAYFTTEQADAACMLISVDDEPAGVAGLRGEFLHGPYLQFLGVLPQFQGRGIGRTVLAWWERQAVAAGERNLWVAVSAFNARARGFYQRCGFSEIAELPGLIDDEYDEILLRKRLKPA